MYDKDISLSVVSSTCFPKSSGNFIDLKGLPIGSFQIDYSYRTDRLKSKNERLKYYFNTRYRTLWFQTLKSASKTSSGTTQIPEMMFSSTSDLYILEVGLGLKYDNLLQYKFYSLDLLGSIQIGKSINSYELNTYDTVGFIDSFFSPMFEYTNETMDIYKGLIPFVYLQVNNEFRISKRIDLLFSLGYEQGFFNITSNKRFYTYDVGGQNENNKTTTFTSNGSAWDYKVGVKYKFFK